MKKEIKQVLAGALVIPVLFLTLGGISYGAVRHKDTDVTVIEDGETMAETIEERGYVRYQEVPRGLLALKDNPAFYCNEYDEEMDGLEKNPADFASFFEDKSLMQDCTAFFVSKCKGFFTANAVLSYDYEKNEFVDKELIQELEENGFQGFGEQLKKLEKCIQRKSVTRKEDEYFESDSESYFINCQGVEFELSHTAKGDFLLEVSANYAFCFAPEKYLAFIKQQTASGEYYLTSSCVGQKRDVLTFEKNNCMIDLCAQPNEEVQDAKENGKRISFVFENGTLVDYFVTVAGSELEWDEEDRLFMETATAGLNKELKKKPKRHEVYFSKYRVYCTKA